MATEPYAGYDLKPLLVVQGDAGYAGAGTGVAWSVESGALPDGLQLNTDGTITGTPSAPGTSSFKIQARYKGRDGQQTYQIIVGNITVGLGTATLPKGMTTEAYAGFDFKPLLTVSGDENYDGSGVTWTIVDPAALPAGLHFNTDGTLSGTPTAEGTYTFEVKASYRTKDGTRAYQVIVGNITVGLSTATLPQGVVSVDYEGFDFKPLLNISGDDDFDGTGVTWAVVDPAVLPAGLTLNSDGTLSGKPTAQGTFNFEVKATYRTKEGTQTYQVQALQLTVALAAATPEQALVGQPYSYDLAQHLSVSGDSAFNGNEATWSIASGTLPPGLSLEADGRVTGVPTTAGTSTVAVKASYRGVDGQQSYQIVTIKVTVGLAAAALPDATQNSPYSYDFAQHLTISGVDSVNGADVTWELASGDLPEGLALSASGKLEGTPTAAGTGVPFQVRATYLGSNGVQSYAVTVPAIKVTLAQPTVPQAVIGQQYEGLDLKQSVTVTGDGEYAGAGAGVTWSVTSGELPQGMSLTAGNGLVSGLPSAAGTDPVVVRAAYKGKSSTAELTFDAKAVVQQFGAYRGWSDGSYAQSCKEYRNGKAGHAYAGATGDGTYRIQVAEYGVLTVWCDMTTDGGGWTRAAYRTDLSNATYSEEFFVREVNVSYSGTLVPNTAMSLNIEKLSVALQTSDAMLKSSAYGTVIENGQGVWSYDQPDCSGPLGHTGRSAGCSNHGANDNWDSADRFNIAIYSESQPDAAIVPGWHSWGPTEGYDLCYPGHGVCQFEFFVR